jgi:hypothetical protein
VVFGKVMFLKHRDANIFFKRNDFERIVQCLVFLVLGPLFMIFDV